MRTPVANGRYAAMCAAGAEVGAPKGNIEAMDIIGGKDIGPLLGNDADAPGIERTAALCNEDSTLE